MNKYQQLSMNIYFKCYFVESVENNLALQLAYNNTFADNRNFIMDNIDLFDGNPWIKELKIECIDAECERNITAALNMKAKVNVIVTFLIKQDNIKKYNRFISVWKRFNKAKADQFEANLKTRLRNEDLE